MTLTLMTFILLGFMFGTQVLDKDGISAGVIVSELASYLHHKGTTVTEHVKSLYDKYVSFCYSCNFVRKSHYILYFELNHYLLSATS